MPSDTLDYVASIFHFSAWCFLVCLGDAKQLSRKMFHLVFLEVILAVPTLDTGKIALYVWNIFCLVSILYFFYKEGTVFNQTYNPKLDFFPLHWILALIAIAIPILLFLFYPDGLYYCNTDTFGDDSIYCTRLVAWGVSYCLEPLGFLPQLAILRKLSKDGVKIKKNIQVFLVLMFASCILTVINYLLEGIANGDESEYMWQFIVVCSGLEAIFVSQTSVFNCLCKRGQFKDDDSTPTKTPEPLPKATKKATPVTATQQPIPTTTTEPSSGLVPAQPSWASPVQSNEPTETSMPTITVSDVAKTDEPAKSSGGGGFFSNAFKKKEPAATNAPTTSNDGSTKKKTTNKNDFSDSWLHDVV